MEPSAEPASPLPPYEVTLDPSTQPRPGHDWYLGVIAAVALALFTRMPYAIGASIALPLFFGWLGIWLASPRALPITLRFFDDSLELTRGDAVHQLWWDHFERAIETPKGVEIELSTGGKILIPSGQLRTDRQALLDALPAHLRFDARAGV